MAERWKSSTTRTRLTIRRRGGGLSRPFNLACGSTIGPGIRIPKAGQIVLAVHDAGEEVAAGLVCDVAYGWLTIETLWVDANQRGQGLGSRLLAAGEELGRARGCHDAHLTTYSFQTPEFYERHGYERFGELHDYPGDQSMVFLRKKL